MGVRTRHFQLVFGVAVKHPLCSTVNPIIGYAFHVGNVRDKESNTLALYANSVGRPYRHFRKPAEVPAGWMPCGSVDWVESVLGTAMVPDYFPGFLQSWVRRKTWITSKWPIGHRVFVKPADRHKRFTGFITSGTWKGRKRGHLLCSEIVSFTNEWRYYVANGEVIAAHWYWGDEQNTPNAPTLQIPWPTDYCGAADFGELSDGRLALVEANFPYACGWYGKLGEGAVYSRWLEAGWNWIRTRRTSITPHATT